MADLLNGEEEFVADAHHHPAVQAATLCFGGADNDAARCKLVGPEDIDDVLDLDATPFVGTGLVKIIRADIAFRPGAVD